MLKNVSFISQARLLVIVIAIGLSMQSKTTNAQEAPLSDDFAMVMRPAADNVEIDENEAQDIAEYFHQAEHAIQSENISALMALYSDEYTNQRDGDKRFATEIWTRIFARFDNISSRHSMKLIDYDKAASRAITECSGLLFGTPEGESNLVLIDRWDDQRHILIKEGNWKLLGDSGKSVPRSGETDEELHPLF